MNDLHWFPYQALRPAGWVLIHAVWQTAAIALLYQGLALRARSPRSRYLLGCLCLVVAVVAPIATVALDPFATSQAAAAAVPGQAAPFEHGHAPHTREDAPVDAGALGHAGAAGSHAVHVADPGIDEEPVATAAAIAAVLDPWAPRLLGLWLVGVALFTARLGFEWLGARRLVDRSARPAPAAVVDHLRHLQERLGVRRLVRVCGCTGLDSPALLGWRRPVILLPGAAAKLPPRELEPVLAHELAHVARHDFAVNVGQAVIECLLFFQPAAAWLSRRVRAERELCCDDIAATCCEGGVLAYARGLADLEAHRLGQPTLAVADGNLLRRIRRLVDPTWRPRRQPVLSTGLVVASLLLAGSASALLPASRAATVLDGLDPVQLIDGARTPGQPGVSAEHEGYRYLFADRASRARFLADPDRYGVVNVAICPATGREVRPEIFRVVDGRIFLFCCPEIRGSDIRVARALPPQPTLPD